MISIRVLTIASAVVLLVTPTLAQAHNMTVVAEVRPEQTDRVQVHAFFDDTTDASEARVRVRDGEGKEVAIGATDAKGLWSFPRPRPGKYTIRVEYVGHDRELILELPDDTSPAFLSTRQPSVILGLAIGLILLLGGSYALRWRRAR